MKKKLKFKVNWRYTIGEILIVIVGITIAFSLNNWKETSNNNIQKEQYLENLVLDIKEEIKQLEDNQVKVNRKLQLIRDIRPFLGNKQVERDSISQKVFELASIVNFNPENSTYLTLVNSGDMKLIKDFELRRSLEEHFALHSLVQQDYERLENIHERYLADFFMYELDFTKVFQGDLSFLDNPLLGNILVSMQGAYFLILSANERCIKSNQELLEFIDHD